jgi:hypothetical protein
MAELHYGSPCAKSLARAGNQQESQSEFEELLENWSAEDDLE